jgi:H+-transporting ATPase
MNTFFGKAAGLIAQVVTEGHLQKVLLTITAGLLVVSVVLCAVIFGKLYTTPDDARNIVEGNGKVLSTLSVVIVILVASIPIAIEVVCTSTLAVGSHTMAEKKVIVARLSAIEELAGMSILCSDKTGTLTQNKLGMRDSILFDAWTNEDVTFYAALASKRDKGAQDAIDTCICNALTPASEAKLGGWKTLHFEPFNPTDKRTVAQVTTADGKYVEVSKGAPHIILRMAHNKDAIKAKVEGSVQELADRGFRALGVGANFAGKDAPPKWEYIGVLSLFDPPRHDTKATIAAAIANGIEVKMVTGDHTAIAKETCRELGMGTSILNTEVLNHADLDIAAIDKIILEAHGFAEVMPEHKYQIVDRLRQMGHVTGMTGDGVNDAPALKRADVGIAVEGATDAARAAADLVLTEPGLSVIIDAIFLARCIFQRMRNYIIYRIACTIQLLCFFFFACLTVLPNDAYMYGTASNANFTGDAAHPSSFTLPVISLVIITILNDGCMITISSDNVTPERKPQKWSMYEMVFIAVIIGLVACISSLLMVAYLMHANSTHPGDPLGIMFGAKGHDYVTYYELRTIIYLKVSISDFLTLFSARTRHWFFERAPSRLLGIAAVIAMSCSTIFSLFWDKMFSDLPGAYMGGLRNSNGAAIATWIYCIIWFLAQDCCKVAAYAYVDNYMQDEKSVEIATFAARHNVDMVDIPQGSLGKASKPAFANGTDLTKLAEIAISDSIRLRNLGAEKAKADAAAKNKTSLADIAKSGDVTLRVEPTPT